MTTYQTQADKDREAERIRVQKVHNTYPHLPFPTPFNPSGLVPYPCNHGIEVKPARFAATKGGNAWLDAEGNEKPPFGGNSWGRAKYLGFTGKQGGVPVPACIVCQTGVVPDDFYIAADGSPLR